MNEPFIPKESDREWMRQMLRLVKDGGTWVTTWAIYTKVDEKTLELKMKNPMKPQDEVDDNVNRVKIVCESMGIKFYG